MTHSIRLSSREEIEFRSQIDMKKDSNHQVQHKKALLSIRQVQFAELRKLHKLFVRSVNDGFSYFSPEFQQLMIRQHNTPRLFKALLSPRANIFVLYHNSENTIVGYCLVRHDRAKSYLYWMYVLPAFRGSGLGSSLLGAALDEARSRRVDALQLVTHDKESYYKSAGFISIRHVAGLLGGVDMAIMEYRF